MYRVETNEHFYVILQKFSKKNFYLCKNSRKILLFACKINVKVRQKARPFHCYKLLNLIFNFLEENLSRISMKIKLTVIKNYLCV